MRMLLASVCVLAMISAAQASCENELPGLSAKAKLQPDAAFRKQVEAEIAKAQAKSGQLDETGCYNQLSKARKLLAEGPKADPNNALANKGPVQPYDRATQPRDQRQGGGERPKDDWGGTREAPFIIFGK